MMIVIRKQSENKKEWGQTVFDCINVLKRLSLSRKRLKLGNFSTTEKWLHKNITITNSIFTGKQLKLLIMW